ncbi:hypothetical protein MSAN_00676300 [Mycena sanguinolenta]|uniref:Uncharacterized protein n=1 Tax=Mycena sanguinolenta TaxID=230812 RepID=A0A8H6Z5Y3_9AGAR|nr:hypothetical protein MSAN_00676300 [Mycena sanguinolenta]
MSFSHPFTLIRNAGNRQAFLPGHRTGAPGVHINRQPGYQLLESKVRVFVAPSISGVLASPLKPYVADGVPVPWKDRYGIFAGIPSTGLTAEHFLKTARKYSAAKAATTSGKTTEADDTKIETVDVIDAAPTPTPRPTA